MISTLFPLFENCKDKSSYLDEKYKLLLTIGEGRYAKVKLAYCTIEKKYVAIKVARKSSSIYQLELLYKEIQALVELKHDSRKNTVSITDFNFSGI